jgi:hypothetical protein
MLRTCLENFQVSRGETSSVRNIRVYISSGSADKHIKQVGTCTTAIEFLGTPHLGSDYAAWAGLGTKIANIVKHANKDIVCLENEVGNARQNLERILEHTEIKGGRKGRNIGNH